MILFRYLVKEVLVAMLAVTVTLLFIVISGRFVKYLAQAAAGDLAPNILFAVMLYRIPSFLELILPLGLFIGILLAYGRLYVESEMTVMSACGVSTGRLIGYTLVPAFAVAAIVAYLSLVASPAGIDQVQRMFSSSESAVGLQVLNEGRFRIEEDSGIVTYVEEIDYEKQQLSGVFFAREERSADGGPALAVVVSEQGELQIDADTGHQYLVLDRGHRYVGHPGQKNYQAMTFARYGQLIEERDAQPYEQEIDAWPSARLWRTDHPRTIGALQWRISLALLVPVVALLALALSRTNHRRGRYVNMFPAFLLYMVYLLVLNAARVAVEEESVPPWIGLWWVHLVFLALALLLVYRSYLWQRLRAWRRH